MRRVLLLFVLACMGLGQHARATVFGQVEGIVHDPQHRPIAGAQVTLRSTTSDFSLTAQSNQDGEFHFAAVPVGNYTVSVQQQGFSPVKKNIAVVSNASPVLHFELSIAGAHETTVVHEAEQSANVDTATTTTLVTREDIARAPGAGRTNGFQMITNYVPGSYVTHDLLHIRGGHQVSWLIDGVPIPNTNIGSNLGPQIDPKDIDTLEAQRGSYAADYGDRTYGVFNVSPRTGFERNNQAELVLSAGNFYQTDD